MIPMDPGTAAYNAYWYWHGSTGNLLGPWVWQVGTLAAAVRLWQVRRTRGQVSLWASTVAFTIWEGFAWMVSPALSVSMLSANHPALAAAVAGLIVAGWYAHARGLRAVMLFPLAVGRPLLASLAGGVLLGWWGAHVATLAHLG
jgi:hypothetical protein